MGPPGARPLNDAARRRPGQSRRVFHQLPHTRELPSLGLEKWERRVTWTMETVLGQCMDWEREGAGEGAGERAMLISPTATGSTSASDIFRILTDSSPGTTSPDAHGTIVGDAALANHGALGGCPPPFRAN